MSYGKFLRLPSSVAINLNKLVRLVGRVFEDVMGTIRILACLLGRRLISLCLTCATVAFTIPKFEE
jgi:hypothetical protein